MSVTAKTKVMCEALLVLGSDQFTSAELVDKMKKSGIKDSPIDLNARLQRLVRNGCVRIANELAVAGGAEAVYEVDYLTIVPYMKGDRAGYELALNSRAQPALFEAWGISLPKGFHQKKFPKARVYKQSWN